MFVNLTDVMLRLCDPFLDANLSKKDKIDPSNVFHSKRLELSGFTALHASSEEFSERLNKDDPGKSNGSGQHTDGENRLLQLKEASSSGTKPENAKYSFISYQESLDSTSQDEVHNIDSNIIDIDDAPKQGSIPLELSDEGWGRGRGDDDGSDEAGGGEVHWERVKER
ncbi:hypothetical protein ACFE04_015908 [Oxalis oulophora]